MSMLNHRFEEDYEVTEETPELDFSDSENYDAERQAVLDDALEIFMLFN